MTDSDSGKQEEALRTFESEPCRRCGGSGFYSYCETWGRTCFACGYAKGVPGTGRRLTKRGAKAREFYLTSFPRKRAADLVPGDVIRDRVYGKRRVVASRPTTSRFMRDGQWVGEDHLDIQTEGMTFGLVPPDAEYEVDVTREERRMLLDRALAYQATLTKAGTPRIARRQRHKIPEVRLLEESLS